MYILIKYIYKYNIIITQGVHHYVLMVYKLSLSVCLCVEFVLLVFLSNVLCLTQ